MSAAAKILIASATGAGLMWTLDSRSGRRRRALLRAKAVRLGHVTSDGAVVVRRDLENRARGAVAAVRGRLRRDDADDEVIKERVRARLGRVCSHPHAIEVVVHDHVVELRGAILASERGRVLRSIRLVRGVHGVEDRLDAHAEPDVPTLQGGSKKLPRTELGQQSWSPGTRFLVGAAGAYATRLGLSRGGVFGALASILGLGLVARSVANEPVRTGYGLLGRRRVTVRLPDESYDLAIELDDSRPEDASAFEGSRISIP